MLNLKSIIIFLFIILGNFTICPCLYSAVEWSEYSTEHFTVYYPKEIPKDNIKNVAERAEEYYVSIAQNLGFKASKPWTWDRRAKIYIYKDEQTFKREAAKRPWAGGSVEIEKRVIRTYPWPEEFLDKPLPHELGHIIFHELVGSKNNIPLWLDEGVAISQENADIKRYSIMMRDFLKNHNPIPMDKLNMITTKTLIVPEIVYPQGASLIDFLLTNFKKEKFQKFCRLLNSGQRLEWALDSAYGLVDLNDLERAWREYLNSLQDGKAEIPISIKAKE